MKTSTSTPIPSLSKSSSLWKLNGKRNNSNKNNRRSTDLTDLDKKSNIDLEVPALPGLDKVHDHSEDLFDLHTKSTFTSGLDSRKSTDTESTLSADGEVIKGTAEKLDLVINTPVMIQAEMAVMQNKSSAESELKQALSQAEEAVSDFPTTGRKPSIKMFTPSSRTSSRKSSMKKPKEITTIDAPKSEKQNNPSSGFGNLFKAHRLLPQKSFENTKTLNNKSAVSLQTLDTEQPPPTPKPSRKSTLKLATKPRKWSIANNTESSINLSTITKNANLFSGSVSKHLAKVQHQTSGSPTRVRSMCFLEEPSKESRSDTVQCLDDTFDAASTFILLDRLHKSMTQGGYITPRLHVPMDMWYQKNVRLPVLDAKITACEVLITLLDKMDSRHTFDNTGNVSRDLKTLDTTLNQIKYSLIRKLQYIEDKGQQAMITQYKTYIGILSKDNASKTSQTFASWGSKLTKSMERINITINPHDQMSLYIKTLIRLFTSVKVLVRWSERLQERYDQSKGETKPIHESILKAHNACVEQFGLIFCGFILRDYTILLDKWMKRAQEWSLD
ncbi:hypothetical protein K501DRAFT_330610 [Backusella circina FSU 941]|nr:hypothetical protein K501DRAFT_330610 [Backusella circina FSU 941]